MATLTYNNLGPIYLTQEKFNTLLTNNTLEAGREYKIIDWEAQEKLVAGTNITIADDGKTISAASPDLSSYATQTWVNENYSTVALKPMKDEWLGYDPELTTEQAAAAILSDEDTKVGDGFLGGVAWSDLSQLDLGNAEVKAFVVADGIVQFEMTSGSTPPYAWFFNSFEGVWRSYVPIADDLTTDDSKSVLSAKQGKTLNDNKLDKINTAKETIYTCDATNQYNRYLINDIINEPDSATDEMIATAKSVVNAIALKSAVSVSDTGVATDEVNYITVNGVEKKIGIGLKFVVLTASEYTALTEKDTNTLYIING